jgi:hypothetical protein
MSYRNTVLTFASGLLLAGLVTAASASVANRRTTLNFSGPVALPGVALATGSYVFELIEGHPDIVQVKSKDRSRVYYMGFTRTVERGSRSGAGVTFGEAPKGQPAPIKAWFPTGEKTGHQFIY